MTTGLFLFLNIGTSEMMLILFVALFLFGGKKLPELARGLGRGIREFKDASESIKKDISEQINNFEEDIDSVKTDIKSITQDSVVPHESVTKDAEERANADAASAVVQEPVSTDHQNDISYADQYYHNYDYNYPEEPAVEVVVAKAEEGTTSTSEDILSEDKGITNS